MEEKSKLLQALVLGMLIADKGLRSQISELAFSETEMRYMARVLKGDTEVPLKVFQQGLEWIFGVEWDGKGSVVEQCLGTLCVNEAFDRFMAQDKQWLGLDMTTEDKARALSVFASLQEKKQDGAAWVDVLKSVLGGNK